MPHKPKSGKQTKGRPSGYKDTYPDAVKMHLKNGKTYAQICRLMGFSMTAFNNYREKEEEFGKTVKEYTTWAQAHWEDVLDASAKGTNTKANSKSLALLMQNRFGYSMSLNLNATVKTVDNGDGFKAAYQNMSKKNQAAYKAAMSSLVESEKKLKETE